MDLKALVALASQLDEKSFVERHPHPALLVRKKSRVSSSEEGHSTELDWRTRTKKNLYSPRPGGDSPRKDPLAKTAYHPLVKSTRNPFAGMITVGRTPNNDVCLASSSVSKLHAYFQNERGGWVVRDSMSSFGTFVDGAKAPPEQAVPVREGAIIGFGPDVEGQFFGAKALHGHLLKLAKELEKPSA